MKRKQWISLSLVVLLLSLAVACDSKKTTPEEVKPETNTSSEEKQEPEESSPKQGAVLGESKLTEFKEFKASTLDGKEFTQEDLKKADLTLIDFWQTGCGPCVAQMPYLAQLQKELPSNVQIITSCLDASGNEEVAKKILKDAGLSVPTIVSGDGDWEREDKKISFTPLYLLVDGEGKVVGEITGLRSGDVVQQYKDVMNEALKKIGKPTF